MSLRGARLWQRGCAGPGGGREGLDPGCGSGLPLCLATVVLLRVVKE